MSKSLIIITDAHLRKSFDVFNILRSNNNFLIFSNSSKVIRFFLSIAYSQKVKYLSTDFNQFLKTLQQTEKDHPCKEFIFLPIEEKTTKNFIRARDLKKIIKFKSLLPQLVDYESSMDKKKLSFFCKRNNITQPESYSLENLLNLDQLPKKLIVKKIIGSGSRGLKFIDNLDDLINFFKDKNEEDWLIQERLFETTKVEGAFFLIQNRTTNSFYSHKRVRTFPRNGGVSVFSVSSQNEELRNLGESILSKLNWVGIAMIEFIYDEITNKYFLIEINPRIWGSILLSKSSGINILQDYIDILQGKSGSLNYNHFHETAIRWIFPYDFMSFIKGEITFKELLSTKYPNQISYVNITYSNFLSSFIFHITLVISKLGELIARK